VASKTAKTPQAFKTSASSDSSSKSDCFYSAASSPLNRSTSSSSFDALAVYSDCSAGDGLLKPAVQTANLNAQTTDTTSQTTVHSSTACCKKDPLNLEYLSDKVQTQRNPSIAPNSITALEQEGPDPTKMELDHDPGQIDFQSTRMDLDKVVQSLQFSLQSDMQNLAGKIHQSNSVISANAATQLDVAHSK